MLSRTSHQNNEIVTERKNTADTLKAKRKPDTVVEISIVEGEAIDLLSIADPDEVRKEAAQTLNADVERKLAEMVGRSSDGLEDIAYIEEFVRPEEPALDMFAEAKHSDNSNRLYKPPIYASVDKKQSVIPGYLIQLKSTDADITLENVGGKGNGIDVLEIEMNSTLVDPSGIENASEGIKEFSLIVASIVKRCLSTLKSLVLVNISDKVYSDYCNSIFAQPFKILNTLVMQSCTINLSGLDENILGTVTALDVDSMQFSQLPTLRNLERCYAGNLEKGYMDNGAHFSDTKLQNDLDEYLLVKQKNLKRLGLTMNCMTVTNDKFETEAAISLLYRIVSKYLKLKWAQLIIADVLSDRADYEVKNRISSGLYNVRPFQLMERCGKRRNFMYIELLDEKNSTIITTLPEIINSYDRVGVTIRDTNEAIRIIKLLNDEKKNTPRFTATVSSVVQFKSLIERCLNSMFLEFNIVAQSTVAVPPEDKDQSIQRKFYLHEVRYNDGILVFHTLWTDQGTDAENARSSAYSAFYEGVLDSLNMVFLKSCKAFRFFRRNAVKNQLKSAIKYTADTATIESTTNLSDFRHKGGYIDVEVKSIIIECEDCITIDDIDNIIGFYGQENKSLEVMSVTTANGDALRSAWEAKNPSENRVLFTQPKSE